jgi:ribosomal protein S18 acetylase RimI-like enzyme
VQIRKFQESDRTDVIALWRLCDLVRPQNDPDQDIDLKMAFQPDLFLVGEIDNLIAGTVMAGYEGHRGWINYLAVSPDVQRGGLGARLMAEAERLLRDLGCVKINLQVRSSNENVQEFYRSRSGSLKTM